MDVSLFNAFATQIFEAQQRAFGGGDSATEPNVSISGVQLRVPWRSREITAATQVEGQELAQDATCEIDNAVLISANAQAVAPRQVLTHLKSSVRYSVTGVQPSFGSRVTVALRRLT